MKYTSLRILKPASELKKSLEKRIIRSDVRSAGIWFVDIPRTGSTSIKHDLVRQYGPCFGKNRHRVKSREKSASYSNRHMLVEAHATAEEMQKTIGAELFNAIYTFSFVRNPLDRFYSIFYYRKLVGDIDPGISFKKCLFRQNCG